MKIYDIVLNKIYYSTIEDIGPEYAVIRAMRQHGLKSITSAEISCEGNLGAEYGYCRLDVGHLHIEEKY